MPFTPKYSPEQIVVYRTCEVVSESRWGIRCPGVAAPRWPGAGAELQALRAGAGTGALGAQDDLQLLKNMFFVD